MLTVATAASLATLETYDRKKFFYKKIVPGSTSPIRGSKFRAVPVGGFGRRTPLCRGQAFRRRRRRRRRCAGSGGETRARLRPKTGPPTRPKYIEKSDNDVVSLDWQIDRRLASL